ncbi:helicase associated domain-containing protein [Streptomyces sp. NPDC050485]|uniref:helicase associated domain-containing protein n=1 Tax=Streptomyces sp. NPDC050485 TaxID=3365617 RepID=UPI0037B347EF
MAVLASATPLGGDEGAVDQRARDLEALGIVWDTADAVFAENLAAARAYFAEAGALAAPRHATALDKPVGQWLTDIRKPSGLGKDPVRAERRAQQLAAVDKEWNPALLGWSVDWQRHHVGLKALLKDGALLKGIVSGVTYRGDDIGRWLTRQRRDFARLNPEQQQRLAKLGVQPAVRARTGAGLGSATFTRGLAALAQYAEREQRTVVPRQHTEQITVDGQDHEVRLGVWVSNQQSRRDKLSGAQLAQLAELGLDWT